MLEQNSKEHGTYYDHRLDIKLEACSDCPERATIKHIKLLVEEIFVRGWEVLSLTNFGI